MKRKSGSRSPLDWHDAWNVAYALPAALLLIGVLVPFVVITGAYLLYHCLRLLLLDGAILIVLERLLV